MLEHLNTHQLLIEIGTEELPPKNLRTLANAFLENMAKALTEAELKFGDIQVFATPRRLALRVLKLASHQPDRIRIKRGPAKNVAFDKEGKPLHVALKFAESCGVSVKDLSEQKTSKGSWLTYEQKEEGQATSLLLPTLLQEALDQLPIAKRMRWSNQEGAFVRPVHWVVLLLDTTVIPGEFFGVHTSNITYGHRFHNPSPIEILEPAQYESLLLNKGHVIADFELRQAKIRTQIESACSALNVEAMIDPNLLDEVTGLVEWPIVLVGTFDPAFLKIPHEALISAMQLHQKCFPICSLQERSSNTNARHAPDVTCLAPKFIIVSNLESIDQEVIIKGNESVVHARLADAAFYYETDKKITLEARSSMLKTVVFQSGLGSLWDKSQRLIELCESLEAKRAALLCKTDLLTYMVGEFPELQGIMGQYYALNDGESKKVALAIEEHYHPRFANDTLPTTPEGCELAIADRIDTLTGLFGLGKTSTGDKDPYGLRRQALGLMRIIIEKGLKVDLQVLFNLSIASYGKLLNKNPQQELLVFCFERLRAWYQEQGITPQEFDAVLANNPTCPYDFHCRIQAVHAFQSLSEAQSLAAANKRVKNILSKNHPSFLDTDIESMPFDKSLLELPAEKALATCILEKEKELVPLIGKTQYKEALQALATLKVPIDHFFDEVMVMVENEALKNNRIALLRHLRFLFLKIADISVL